MYYWRKYSSWKKQKLGVHRYWQQEASTGEIKLTLDGEFMQPRVKYGATMTKLDGFYMFGGKSHQVHNDIDRLDFNISKWTTVDTDVGINTPQARFGH
jgi:hypothetical protein